MNTVKKGLSVLLSIVLWIIILITALFTFTTLATRDQRSVSNLAGYTPLIVKTQSMLPTFDAGDMIIIKTCDPDQLKVGDIITFHAIINNEYALNTHRIADISETGGVRSYTTKGDNNDIADTHIISNGDIVGKFITKIPLMGHVMAFLSGSVGFLVVIVLPMLCFFIYQVYHLVMVSINLKKALAVEEAEAKALAQSGAANTEAEEKLKEAQAALEEAKRIKQEAEEQLKMVQESKEE